MCQGFHVVEVVRLRFGHGGKKWILAQRANRQRKEFCSAVSKCYLIKLFRISMQSSSHITLCVCHNPLYIYNALKHIDHLQADHRLKAKFVLGHLGLFKSKVASY